MLRCQRLNALVFDEVDSVPQVTVINQPFSGHSNRIGDHLVTLLSRSSERFTHVRMAAAFAKASGVAILFDSIQGLISSGGQVQIAVGINHQGTSRQGLDLLLQTGAAVYVFHNPGSETFHPKFYLFQRDVVEGVALIGSSNLTRGGLYENFEFNVRLDHNLHDALDSVGFQVFIDAFDTIIDLTTGTSLLLDVPLLAELDRRGYLLDEARPPTPPVAAGRERVPTGAPPLFRRVPMPRGPRPSPRVPVVVGLPQPGQATVTFTMTLGPRDTRQRPGYSRDIFIPISARNANAGFWEWPNAYTPPASGASGGYLERRVDLQITPVVGATQLVRQVRIYTYAGRGEFRLNCSDLVHGAGPGDILVLSRVPTRSGYHYDAAVISQQHRMYNAFWNLCVNVVAQSGKRWGYS